MLPSFISNLIWGEEKEEEAEEEEAVKGKVGCEEALELSATEEAGDWIVISCQIPSERG